MQDIQTQIQRLEAVFDELHDFLCESEGETSDITMKALKGSLYCRGLFCDLLNEQGQGEG